MVSIRTLPWEQFHKNQERRKNHAKKARTPEVIERQSGRAHSGFAADSLELHPFWSGVFGRVDGARPEPQALEGCRERGEDGKSRVLPEKNRVRDL
jgi:hypothetical protein